MIYDIEIQRLDGPPPSRFDCGRPEQNEFLHRHAWPDQLQLASTTYLVYLDGLVAAYAAVCVESIHLAREERDPKIRFAQVGSVKLAQLGVRLSFQGRGIGKRVVDFVVQLARRSSSQIASRYVSVDAKPDLVDWYDQLGFVRNRLHQERRIQEAVTHRRNPEGIAVSMRFDLK
jgi:GNAT superfamily N-acetyltransferase